MSRNELVDALESDLSLGDETLKVVRYGDDKHWVVGIDTGETDEEGKPLVDPVYSGRPDPVALLESFAHSFGLDLDWEDKELEELPQELAQPESTPVQVDFDESSGGNTTGSGSGTPEDGHESEGDQNELKVYIEPPSAEDIEDTYEDDDDWND